MPILKTVIGSFPSGRGSAEDSIKANLELQLKHRIDIVSDGEPRANMINYFESVPGLARGAKGLQVAGRIEPPAESESFVKVRDYLFSRNYLDSTGRRDVPIKVTFTGPITLAFSCALNGLKYYSNLKDLRLYEDLAEALSPLIREVARRNAHVQLDEPGLSARFIETKSSIRAINTLVQSLPSSLRDDRKLSIHICGAITKDLFEEFLLLDVPVLSIAFSGPLEVDNIKSIDQRKLQENRKSIGVGCVTTEPRNATEVDDVQKILGRLRMIERKIGYENLAYSHPDCGLRGTAEAAIPAILANLSEASDLFEKGSS